MINNHNKEKCAGCGACIKICPTNAIDFYVDEEGFNYPRVKTEKCVNCGLCEKICPWLNPEFAERIETRNPIFYAAQLREKKQLKSVSSGGAAWALALYVVSLGGVVYGAVQEAPDVIYHGRCENIEELKRIRRSKYLQSDLRNTFVNALEDLNNKKLVLFTGTGCQVASLLAFVQRDYENLITADVVCHGVPSPRVWKDYKSETEIKKKAQITGVIYRDKSKGWLNNQYAISYSDGTIIKEESCDNPFHRGYLFGLYSRPSCGNCKFNLLPRISDFTFADYWLYAGTKFQDTLQQGISLVAVNTEKADNIAHRMKEILEFENTTRELALNSCRQMNNAPLVSEDRESFWKLYKHKGFYKAWKRYIKEKKKDILIRYAKKAVKRLCGSIQKQ